ncbi:MAG: Structural maintenance of chromosomes protein 6 [Claussenomyces sp. TS43310]|nr:MAG: Structural maintenance of chromosomes protein 6 [Claussenomyces sp. TS43310]
MASTKRTRPALEEEEDEEGEGRGEEEEQDGEEDLLVESRAANPQRDSRKKARLSQPSQRSKTKHITYRSSSPSETEDAYIPGANEKDVPASTQHEIERDGNFSHLEHEELDDARATQKLLARSELIGENHAAENGIIESVTMINFMCHEKLHVTLGPLINFIIGENGSGKSAILTAITLCLGGKASTTNRGGSLKSFIKGDEEHASLVIRLKNKGEDAYQPDTYGDVIIVERHFSRSGTSGFKLKNEGGRMVSTKKADVEEVIEYFQMQVDNPMNVMSQDNARQFIHSTNPCVKYKNFVKGVQLEQLDNDYQLLGDTANAMEAKLDITSNNVKVLKTAMIAAAEKARVVKQHDGLRLAADQYGRQMAWAQVEEEEQRLLDREKLVAEAQAEIERKERDAEVKGQEYQQIHEHFKCAEEALNELTETLGPLKEEELVTKANFDAATQELQNSHLEHRQIREYLNAAKGKAKAVQKDIDTELQRIENSNGGVHAQRLTELAVAQQKVTEAKASLVESEGQSPQLEEQHQAATEEYKRSIAQVETRRKEVHACEAQLQALSRGTDRVMAGFDPKMPRLLTMIREDTGFREKPVGPVGLHIRLLKPVWSTILERSIGSLLNGFIVTSKADQQRLSGLLRRLDLNFCPVVIGNHHPLDTTGHEPDEQYDTVLRVLEIDSDLVRRQLIISQGIEQTILVEKRKDAVRILYDNGRPRNVKQCFCLNDGRRGWGIRLSYMAGSNEGSSGPIQPTGRSPRMKTDSDSQVAFHTETLAQLRLDQNQLETRRHNLLQAVQRCSQAIIRQKRTDGELQMQFQRAEDQVDRIQEELDRDNVEDGRLDALREYLMEVSEELRVHEGSYGEAVLAKEKQNVMSSGLKKVHDAVKERIADHEARIKKAEHKVRRIQQARQIALQEKNIALDTIQDARKVKEAAEQKREKQAARVADFIEQATKVCQRVSVEAGMTAASLDARLTKIRDTLKTYNRRLGGTDDEILENEEKTKIAYRTAEKQLEGLMALFTVLRKTYRNRLMRWRKFQRYISARSRIQFTYLLSERGFRGRLILDHKHRLLDLKVEPDETTRSSRGRQTKTLSGGEKSFSNVCMLLALWEAMGAPLRCLDEFDVYMDSVNRDISTNMIIGAARRSVGRQYILITPLAIGGNAQYDRDVKLIRLTDPRQKTLADQ